MYEQRGVADVDLEDLFTLAVPTIAPLKTSVLATLRSFSALRDITSVGASSCWRIVRITKAFKRLGVCQLAYITRNTRRLAKRL